MLLVHLFVCFARFRFCPFPLSSWCRGLAAVCDCGSPWTFLLTFLFTFLLFLCKAEDTLIIFFLNQWLSIRSFGTREDKTFLTLKFSEYHCDCLPKYCRKKNMQFNSACLC